MSTDKILSDVREAKAFDIRRGTGPRRNTPKPSHETPSMDVSPDAEPAPATSDNLHSALMSVGDSLMKYHDKPASLASIGHSLKQVALKIAPSAPDIGPNVEP